MRLVVIGGDAAGMSTASEARRRAPDAEIVVLEATEDVSYGACGLPYKLDPATRVDDLVIISADRFRAERRLDVRLGHRVERLEPADHRVRGTGPDGAFDLTYDKLVVATGARAAVPPIPGLEGLLGQGAYTLKTLEDGRRLRRALDEGKPKSAVVIGAGYIGLEATDGLRERGLAVTVVEAMPDVIPFAPESQRGRVREEAMSRGVELRVGTRTTALERSSSGTIRVSTNAGELDCDLVLVATGVRPNSELGADAGLALGASRSIAVDELLATSAPDVWSAGDCADAKHVLTGESVWIPLALRANRAGKLAAQNALGGSNTISAVLGTAAFKFFGLEIARTGFSLEEAQRSGFDAVAAEVVSATRAKYYPGGGKLSVGLVADRKTRKLLGATMVGPESAAHRIDTIAASLHGGLTAEQLYDMDLAYAPPFGPSWSPLLIAASQLIKQLGA